MWVPFWRPFPGNEAHKLFSGGPKWGVLGGGRKVYVEKVYVLFPSPRMDQEPNWNRTPDTVGTVQPSKFTNPDNPDLLN